MSGILFTRTIRENCKTEQPIQPPSSNSSMRGLSIFDYIVNWNRFLPMARPIKTDVQVISQASQKTDYRSHMLWFDR